jgi:hypothetical protein
VRPDVVWFGEQLPAQALEAAWAAARNCDIFLSVGTSSLVQPAASLPLAAVESGAVLVEINPGETPLSPHAHYRLRGPAGSLLPQLLRAAWCSQPPRSRWLRLRAGLSWLKSTQARRLSVLTHTTDCAVRRGASCLSCCAQPGASLPAGGTDRPSQRRGADGG